MLTERCGLAEVEKKMKFFKFILISAFVATLIIPMANAEIIIKSINVRDVIASSSPVYGNLDVNIQLTKTQGQDESLTIPISINGTVLKTVTVQMKVNETIKFVPVNVVLPGASKLMISPFVNSVPTVPYDVKPNPYANPISNIQYELKIGDITKNISVLVYADWTLWAVIIDIIVIIGVFLFIRKLAKG